jgi:signal recognition particle receptor subunit beta
MYASGKTTILDTLYRLTKEENKDIIPTENLTKIESSSGSTLYFDKGLFQSKKQNKVYYLVYTVAGQKSYSKLRKKVFEQTDGIIFVVDSQKKCIEDNIEFLKELKAIASDKLIKEIPMVVMLNKQDLAETIKAEDFKKILKEEKLWFNSNHALGVWNPKIFLTCALYNKQRNVYESFYECSRRAVMYQIYGDGRAPPKDKVPVSLAEK